LLLAGWVALAGVGCKQGTPPPKTYPATGKVVTKRGTPLGAGLIQFVPTGGTRYTTTGEIKPDGTFSLSTLVDGKHVDGAVEGTYDVTVLPASADQTVPSIHLPRQYTVKAEGKNHFEITIDK